MSQPAGSVGMCSLPRGTAMARAQVTWHLQFEPPLDWPAHYSIPRAAGRWAEGLSSLTQPQEAQRRRSGLPLPSFQKLLLFLQPQQLLEWTAAQTPSQCQLPHAHPRVTATRRDVFCPWLVRVLEILGKSYSGAIGPEKPPTANIILG